MRLEAARAAVSTLDARGGRRRELVAALEAEAAADTGDDGAAERIAALDAELARLAEDRRERVAREIVELEARVATAAAELERRTALADEAASARSAAAAAADEARRARRALDGEAESARRESARAGAELARVNQFLRAQAGAPGGAAALADALRAAPGYELALAAALGPRLRAAVAADLAEAAALLDRAGRDGGAALVAPGDDAPGSPASSPAPGATPLLDHVSSSADGPAAALAAAVLDAVWVVDDLAALAPGFAGIAVTRDGRVWSPRTRELRQVARGGEDRVLAERNRREELVRAVEVAAQAEQAALARVDEAAAAVAAADAVQDEADRTARAAARAREDAAEGERHARRAVETRRNAPDEGEPAARRAELESAIATERRLAERAERDRADRARRVDAERERLRREEALAPVAERLAAALDDAGAAVAVRVEALAVELEADRRAGERLAAELRSCAQVEAGVQARLKARGEEVTRGEVRAQQTRDRTAEAGRELAEVAHRLGLPTEPAEEPLGEGERAVLEARIERLRRRREQLGPVNPLAQQEFREAVAHVEELERQREDLETALRELQALIRDTDQRIRDAFEQTFEAAARNFEDVARHLFPGGRGRLRLVRDDSGPRPVLGGGEADESAPSAEERLDEATDAGERDEDEPGVEIEITPAGKATKRLTLLSGGEKSLTALAFLFAVFLARPCPFYILDEVEAALDDLNIDRFLTLLRRYSDRAQFIVVTHQKRTMEAADCLYGVSMAGNGVSKVISRRLPPAEPAAA
jgi:chromosome segregation protein